MLGGGMWRRGMVVVVQRKGEQGGTNLCADARTGDISFRGFALRICKGHRWQPEFDLGNRIAREAVGCRGGEFDECNDDINDLGFQMLSDLAGEFPELAKISRQSHQCPYLPPFTQKSPEPVCTGSLNANSSYRHVLLIQLSPFNTIFDIPSAGVIFDDIYIYTQLTHLDLFK